MEAYVDRVDARGKFFYSKKSRGKGFWSGSSGIFQFHTSLTALAINETRLALWVRVAGLEMPAVLNRHGSERNLQA